MSDENLTLRLQLASLRRALSLVLDESHLCGEHNPACRCCVQVAALSATPDDASFREWLSSQLRAAYAAGLRDQSAAGDERVPPESAVGFAEHALANLPALPACETCGGSGIGKAPEHDGATGYECPDCRPYTALDPLDAFVEAVRDECAEAAVDRESFGGVRFSHASQVRDLDPAELRRRALARMGEGT